MIRVSKHSITKISNQVKLNSLDQLFVDYKHDLEIYINYIIDGILPIKTYYSSKLLPTETLKHSKYKREIYKQASEIIRSQLDKSKNKRFKKYKQIYSYMKKNHPDSLFCKSKFSELNLKDIVKSKFFTKPKLNNISINLTNEFFNVKNGKHFDLFVNLKLPYFNQKGTRALQINLPLNHHKHSNSLKSKNFTLRNSIQLKKVDDKYYINLFWENNDIKIKQEGRSLGIDTGYKKIIVTSDNQILGTDDMVTLYKNICNKKKRNSKNYKDKLTHRDNLVNYYVNQIKIDDINKIIIEKLYNVKHKSKFINKTNDLISRWTYRPLINKIKRMCEANGIELVEVPPAYTSQTCSSCGEIHKESRSGELYKCIKCGYEIDADYNAAINILNKGAYSPLD